MPQKSDVKGSKTSNIIGKCQKLSDVIYGRSPIRWPVLFIRERQHSWLFRHVHGCQRLWSLIFIDDIDTYVCIIDMSHFCHISDTINKRHLIIHRCFFDRCVTKIRSTTMNQKLECLCFTHRLRTHNCCFPNSFWPISFLGYIQARSEQ